jgi:thymidylate synthase ThyX
MKVTYVALKPTEAALAAGKVALTAEELAATGARYSRNGEGLEAILEKIDLGNKQETLEKFLTLVAESHRAEWDDDYERFHTVANNYRPGNPDKGVDSIFKMVDYGHASIADMAPVAMFLDNVSVYLVYWIWSQVPTASGQETSTRYCKFSAEGLPSAEALGVVDAPEWTQQTALAFDAYNQAYALWSGIFEKDPTVAKIPSSLIEEAKTDEKARLKLERLKRNYAFDRARCFIPAAVQTNVMLVMNARGWTELIQKLLSQPLSEGQALGKLLREELELVTPRLVKHAVAKAYWTQGFEQEFKAARQTSYTGIGQTFLNETLPITRSSATSPVHLAVWCPETEHTFYGHQEERNFFDGEFYQDLEFHENRYAWVGAWLRRTFVRFSIGAVDFACLRDMNRHRTGYKFAPLIPVGFYWAEDELPSWAQEERKQLEALAEIGRTMTRTALNLLTQGYSTYVYWLVLGAESSYEHGTTADKFLYECELRTGVGALYKYANDYRRLLKKWYALYPKTQARILEGSAEPE